MSPKGRGRGRGRGRGGRGHIEGGRVIVPHLKPSNKVVVLKTKERVQRNKNHNANVKSGLTHHMKGMTGKFNHAAPKRHPTKSKGVGVDKVVSVAFADEFKSIITGNGTGPSYQNCMFQGVTTNNSVLGYIIDPYTLGGRVANMASNFAMWKIKNISIHYVPETGYATQGNMAIAIVEDPSSLSIQIPSPPTIQWLASYGAHITQKALTDGMSVHYVPKEKKFYYIDEVNLPASASGGITVTVGEDPRMYEGCCILAVSDGTGSGNTNKTYGTTFIKGILEFSQPITPVTPVLDSDSGVEPSSLQDVKDYLIKISGRRYKTLYDIQKKTLLQMEMRRGLRFIASKICRKDDLDTKSMKQILNSKGYSVDPLWDASDFMAFMFEGAKRIEKQQCKIVEEKKVERPVDWEAKYKEDLSQFRLRTLIGDAPIPKVDISGTDTKYVQNVSGGGSSGIQQCQILGSDSKSIMSVSTNGSARTNVYDSKSDIKGMVIGPDGGVLIDSTSPTVQTSLLSLGGALGSIPVSLASINSTAISKVTVVDASSTANSLAVSSAGNIFACPCNSDKSATQVFDTSGNVPVVLRKANTLTNLPSSTVGGQYSTMFGYDYSGNFNTVKCSTDGRLSTSMVGGYLDNVGSVTTLTGGSVAISGGTVAISGTVSATVTSSASAPMYVCSNSVEAATGYPLLSAVMEIKGSGPLGGSTNTTSGAISAMCGIVDASGVSGGQGVSVSSNKIGFTGSEGGSIALHLNGTNNNIDGTYSGSVSTSISDDPDIPGVVVVNRTSDISREMKDEKIRESKVQTLTKSLNRALEKERLDKIYSEHLAEIKSNINPGDYKKFLSMVIMDPKTGLPIQKPPDKPNIISWSGLKPVKQNGVDPPPLGYVPDPVPKKV